MFWVKSLLWHKALLQWVPHFYGHSHFEPSYEVTGPAVVAISLCHRNIVLLVSMLSKTGGYFGFTDCVGLQCQHLVVWWYFTIYASISFFPLRSFVCLSAVTEFVTWCGVVEPVSADTKGELSQWFTTRARLTSCLCYGDNEVVGMMG